MSTLAKCLLLLALLPLASLAQDDQTQSVDFQLCNNGCIKCSSVGKCEFCDIRDDNFLKNDTCAKFSINNCVEYTYDGNCKQCDPVYYLAEGVCELIDESNRIPNCLVHRSPGICQTCQLEYILVQGECIAITTTKDGCVTYNESGTLCTNCANFVLSTDFQICDKNYKPTANCQ